MSKTKLSDFAERERDYIETRCAEPFESTLAPQSEYQLFEARMKAIDSIEKLYEEAERELEVTRNILERIDQSAFKSTGGDAVQEAPDSTKVLSPVGWRRHLEAA